MEELSESEAGVVKVSHWSHSVSPLADGQSGHIVGCQSDREGMWPVSGSTSETRGTANQPRMHGMVSLPIFLPSHAPTARASSVQDVGSTETFLWEENAVR